MLIRLRYNENKINQITHRPFIKKVKIKALKLYDKKYLFKTLLFHFDVSTKEVIFNLS